MYSSNMIDQYEMTFMSLRHRFSGRISKEFHILIKFDFESYILVQ